MSCCLDCIRFLNRKGYQKINGKNNISSSYNKLKQIVVIKNDDSKEIYNLNNKPNVNKKYKIDKLSLKEIERITKDEDDIIFDLNNIYNKNAENIQNNDSIIQTKGIVNNSKNENFEIQKYNKLNPKKKLEKKLNKRNFLNLKKNDLNITENKSEIQNKCFTKEKLSDNSDDGSDNGFEILNELEESKDNSNYSNYSNYSNINLKIVNNNLRNRNDGLSDLEWDIISDDVF